MGEARLALRRFARRRAGAWLGAVYLVLLIAGALLAPRRRALRSDQAGPRPHADRALARAPRSAPTTWAATCSRACSTARACRSAPRAWRWPSPRSPACPSAWSPATWAGPVDDALMRVIDALQAFPALILAMAIAAALGPGLFNVMVAVGIVYTPRFARLVRGQVLSLREEPFVESARAAGASHARVLARHVLPNVVAPGHGAGVHRGGLRAAGRDRAVLPRRRASSRPSPRGAPTSAAATASCGWPLARLHAGHRRSC